MRSTTTVVVVAESEELLAPGAAPCGPTHELRNTFL